MRKRWERLKYLVVHGSPDGDDWKEPAALIFCLLFGVLVIVLFILTVVALGEWSGGWAALLFVLITFYTAFLAITKETTKK